MQDFMTLRPFNINDAPTILSWCKDKHAFRLWSADRYKEFPAQPDEMIEQYKGENMYPLTAVVEEEIIEWSKCHEILYIYIVLIVFCSSSKNRAACPPSICTWWNWKEMGKVVLSQLLR